MIVVVLAAMCLLWEERDITEWKEADQKLAAEVKPLSFSLFSVGLFYLF